MFSHKRQTKADTGTGAAPAAFAATSKSFEDQFTFVDWHARTLVFDLDADVIAVVAKADLSDAAGVLVGVLAEVTYDLGNTPFVEFDDESTGPIVVDDWHLALSGNSGPDGLADEFTQHDFFDVELHGTYVEPADFEQVFNE